MAFGDKIAENRLAALLSAGGAAALVFALMAYVYWRGRRPVGAPSVA